MGKRVYSNGFCSAFLIALAASLFLWWLVFIAVGSLLAAPPSQDPILSGEVVRVVVYLHPEVTYPPRAYPAYYADQGSATYTTNVYGVNTLRENLIQPDPWLRRGAWRADRVGDTWEVIGSDPRLYPWVFWPSGDQIAPLITALSHMTITGSVPRIRDQGFNPAPGDCGLAKPYAELAILLDDGSMRWIVLGNQAADGGLYAFVFSKIENGADGYPHPLGLFRIGNADPLYRLIYQLSVGPA